MKAPHVLIVEDDPLISLFIKEILVDEGYVIAGIARDTINALKKVKTSKIDLIILDIHLEGNTTGIDFAREIRGSGFDIPIIFLSSYSDKEHRDSAFTTRPTAFLTKPFKEVDLVLAAELALKEDHPKDAGTQVDESEGFLLSEHIFIKDGRTFRKFLLTDIFWIKGEGSYCEIHTRAEKTVVRNTLKKFQSLLDEKGFMKVHRSYVANLANMTAFGPDGLEFGDQLIPANKEKREEIIRRIRKIT